MECNPMIPRQLAFLAMPVGDRCKFGQPAPAYFWAAQVITCARGVLQKKKNKKPRPIVMAPVKDRVVQRAILQVLQDHKSILNDLDTPYSFGGLQEKNVEKAVLEVQKTMRSGASYFIKSDIKQFFTKIDKTKVMEIFSKAVPFKDVIEVLERSLETQLCKEDEDRLGNDIALFPLDETGIAQGSCLSPLIANIYLSDFDRLMNQKGIKCFRYIDDLLLIGPKSKNLKKAFESGKSYLKTLGLDVYDPFAENNKADIGNVDSGFDFLGCRIYPGLIQPSPQNRHKFLKRLKQIVSDSKKELNQISSKDISIKLGFIKTLDSLNNAVLGWGHAFSFCNDFQIMSHLDSEIEKIASEYLQFVFHKLDENGHMLSKILGLHNIQTIAKEKREKDLKAKEKS